jgi:2-keto-4-pentenoate hydratase/2-oxohepta-3-ene-1,7-dioic acid hydratase in catechol pathway
VVIGRRCRNLAEGEDIRSYIRGYTCVNDVTARDLQKKDGQWARAKGFDTFCPVGPFLVTGDELDAASLEVTTRLNGAVKQRGNTRDFIFDLEYVLRYISKVMTLEPGDLISTGTPAGVAPMKSGDMVEVEITGIGTLRNRVS